MAKDETSTDIAARIAEEVTQAKSLLVRVLEETGNEPFFHGVAEQQERAVRAATMRAILECAFNLFEDNERSAMLDEHFTVAIEQASRGDEATLRRALVAIERACLAAADAWFAAQQTENLCTTPS